MARSQDIKAPKARFAFTKGLFEAQQTQSGKMQYGASLLWPKGTNLDDLKKAAADAAVAEWGDKAIQMIKDGLIHSPFLDGDGPQGKSKKTGEPHAGFPGSTFVRVISGAEFKPKIVDRRLLPIVSVEDFPSGSWGFPVVNAFTWENKEKGKGISFGVSLVQVTQKAEGADVLGGGGASPESYFEKIEDDGPAPEATKTGAGAGGLFG